MLLLEGFGPLTRFFLSALKHERLHAERLPLLDQPTVRKLRGVPADGHERSRTVASGYGGARDVEQLSLPSKRGVSRAGRARAR